MNNKYVEMKAEAIADIMDILKNGYSGYYCDLHNEVFNTDYYIIGTYEAERALTEYGVFKAIEIVKEYEEFNFGELYTNISDPKRLINMLYYIIGEEVISEMYAIPEFNDNWDSYSDEETNAAILIAMTKLF